jgi:hypothetical protein
MAKKKMSVAAKRKNKKCQFGFRKGSAKCLKAKRRRK